MANFYKIPTKSIPEIFKITLSNVDYWITLKWQNTSEGGWFMDIADINNEPIVNGIPLVTGANLLAQYPHLNFGGRMWVQTAAEPDAVPTYTNLGTESFIYWVTD